MNERTRQTEQELPELQNRIGFRWLWCAALALALFVGMGGRVSIDYHMLLKVATCASFVIWAMAAHAKGMTGWRNLFVLVAVVFNPLLPVRLTTSWPLIYFLTGGLALVPAVLGHMGLSAFRLESEKTGQEKDPAAQEAGRG